MRGLVEAREEEGSSGHGASLLQVLVDVHADMKDDLKALRDVLERIGSDEWYPERNPETGEYDVDNIRSTDWLIDQIVYRLYGLTEEEIRVVEGVEGGGPADG